MTVIQIQSYVNLILSPLHLLVPNSIYGFVTLLQSHILILFLISKYFITLLVCNSSVPPFGFTHFKLSWLFFTCSQKDYALTPYDFRT